MSQDVWPIIAVALGGAYLYVLGWNTLAAAFSYMGRTHQRRFPLGRCVSAAAGPSALPLTFPFALAFLGLGRDGVLVVFVLLWGLSFWFSAWVERKLTSPRPAVESAGAPDRA
jgi:hypothetical protein